jgi:NADPH-dependent glutamate synthase beta subunit-like oxidoreductase
VDLIAQARYEEALNLIEQRIPLVGAVSRICPRPCELKCNRQNLDEPIAINALKRYAFDAVTGRKERRRITPATRTRNEKVAVIGSGPAGLTAAHTLVKSGYGVTIYEAAGIPGGMMAMGIPEYRLPRQLLRAEIDNIRRLGVEIKLNAPVGKNGLTLDALWTRGYKAVFLAVGAHKSIKLGVPNEEVEGVVDGASWLKEINLGGQVKVGEKVVVIGGGNVAIDSARTARRLGAKTVTIIYRRSSEEMPAIRDEVIEAEKEGIHIRYLSSPCRIVCDKDACQGIECVMTELGEPDGSGRRRPIRIEGTEFVLDADMVISAIGEFPDLSFLQNTAIEVTQNDTIKVNPHTLATNIRGVFAGGDAVSGPATVIDAVAAGRKAAIAMDRYLRGEDLDYKLPIPEAIPFEDLDLTGFKKRKRQKMPCLDPKQRIKSFREVELGLTEISAHIEAERCLQCGMFPKKERSS